LAKLLLIIVNNIIHFRCIVNPWKQPIIPLTAEQAKSKPVQERNTNMEAITSRGPVGSIDLALAEWLKATRKLVRAALIATGNMLVNTSRAGLLVRAGNRRRLRQLRP
jgi:hypothetical protein